jgi:pyruvate/2-oxoglutarate dehydrogenase complex dihydrolipoamide acyltransferase (E2) component
VFERLTKGARAVPQGTLKITIEMPATYTGIQMPADLLVRDDDELARIEREEQDDDDSELSDLDDEMFGLEKWYLHQRVPTREQRKEMEKKKAAERKEDAKKKKEEARQKQWEKEQADNAPEQAEYAAAKARGEEVDLEDEE